MFEGFNVPALMIRNSAVLSLYSYGFTRGVAIETGDALSYVIPVIEGKLHTHKYLIRSYPNSYLTQQLLLYIYTCF